MISIYKWKRLKELGSEGVSIKDIVRELKLSRNTVRKYLKSSEPLKKYKVHRHRKKINGYEEYIREMYEKGYKGIRIYSELLERGYGGSLTGLYRYIHEIRKKGKRQAKEVIRE